MCLGYVQGVFSYPDNLWCIIPKERYTELVTICVDIWNQDMDNKGWKSGEDRVYVEEMDVWDVSEG